MGVKSPAASGRVAVRSTLSSANCHVRKTFLSRLRSHMSLMVQPAPRIITEPTPKRPSMENICVGPTWAWAAARVILHACLSHVSIGRYHRASITAMSPLVYPIAQGTHMALLSAVRGILFELREEGRELILSRRIFFAPGEGILKRWGELRLSRNVERNGGARNGLTRLVCSLTSRQKCNWAQHG